MTILGGTRDSKDDFFYFKSCVIVSEFSVL